MKKYSILAIAVTICALGCGKAGRSLTGEWKASGIKNMPEGASMVFTMAEPDSLKMTMDFSQDVPGGKPIAIHGDVTGSYKLEGETMTIKATDVKFSATGLPEAAKPMFDSQIKSMNEGLKKQINEDGASKFKWVNDDSFTMTGKDGSPATFTRKK